MSTNDTHLGIVTIRRCSLPAPTRSIGPIANASRRFMSCHSGGLWRIRPSCRIDAHLLARSIRGSNGVEWRARRCGLRHRRLLLDKFPRSV
jgi:hypothetical protein